MYVCFFWNWIRMCELRVPWQYLFYSLFSYFGLMISKKKSWKNTYNMFFLLIYMLYSHTILFFFWIRGNLTLPESALYGPRWGSKTGCLRLLQEVHALTRTRDLLCRSQTFCHHATPLRDFIAIQLVIHDINFVYIKIYLLLIKVFLSLTFIYI
jgi:hypothetical protein